MSRLPEGIAIVIVAVSLYWSVTRLWLFGPRDEDGRK